jgi:hypothetical protein
MRARALLIVVIVLILAALACGVPETRMSEPGLLDTAVAQTVQALSAAATAQAEPTGTPTPTATDTLTPTPTDTPPPLPATSTPAPTDAPIPTAAPLAPSKTPTVPPTETPAACVTEVAAEFKPRLDARPEIALALGCPTGERQQTWVAEERFQRGRMFWRQDTDMVYILYDGGAFQAEPDRFVDGDPEDACPEIGGAPEGLFKPARGFNWQWCHTPGVRDGLGWALEEEAGHDAIWQAFERGDALQGRADHIFIFYHDGTWGYIE